MPSVFIGHPVHEIDDEPDERLGRFDDRRVPDVLDDLEPRTRDRARDRARVLHREDAVELCAHGPKWIGRKNVTPQDIAESAAMLCSEAGRFVTGCEVPFLFH